VVLISPYIEILLVKSCGLRANGYAYIRLEANGDAILTVCLSDAG
jgi:hypothetical protein